MNLGWMQGMGLTRAWPWMLALGLAALVWQLVPADQPALGKGLALFTLIAVLWMTQALHLSVTALLVPVLAVALGLMAVPAALASFAHPIIFVFLGGFALATALQQQGLDKALAHAVLRLARGHRLRAVLLLFGLTAVLSMWISNTATAAMMLPLALGLLNSQPEEAPLGRRESAFVLLGLAYSASIGGIGSLVGSPPNAIAAAQAGIGFAQWLAIGLPMVLVLLPLMVGVLWLVLRPELSGRLTLATAEPMVWTRQRRLTVAIFGVTALAWVLAVPLARWLGVVGDMDSWIAITALVALVLAGCTSWDAIEHHTHWGVLILFGGGLALSKIMETSGASAYLAHGLVALLQGAPSWLLLLVVVAFVVFLTELVSNTASAALMVPIFMGVGQALGLPPALLAAAIAVAASCAFMLPVATPPNALVFATGAVPASDMMRVGWWLNLLCVVAITALSAWLLM